MFTKKLKIPTLHQNRPSFVEPVPTPTSIEWSKNSCLKTHDHGLRRPTSTAEHGKLLRFQTLVRNFKSTTPSAWTHTMRNCWMLVSRNTCMHTASCEDDISIKTALTDTKTISRPTHCHGASLRWPYRRCKCYAKTSYRLIELFRLRRGANLNFPVAMRRTFAGTKKA